MNNLLGKDVQYISNGTQGLLLKIFRRLSGSSYQGYHRVAKLGPTLFSYLRTKKKY